MSSHTHITVLLDRSGSMESVRTDTVGGFNAFIAQQRAAPGQVTLTLVQFDSQDPYEVLCSALPVRDVPPLTVEQFVPRASTPLYDAIGRGIVDLDALLIKTPLAWRPTNLLLVIVTDGQENASREFSRCDIRRLLEARKKQGWDVIYLSSDLGSLKDARSLGVDYSSSLLFDPNSKGVVDAFQSMGDSVLRKRGGAAATFSDADRKTIGAEK